MFFSPHTFLAAGTPFPLSSLGLKEEGCSVTMHLDSHTHTHSLRLCDCTWTCCCPGWTFWCSGRFWRRCVRPPAALRAAWTWRRWNGAWFPETPTSLRRLALCPLAQRHRSPTTNKRFQKTITATVTLLQYLMGSYDLYSDQKQSTL